jgi:thiol-disulfide isomerase/thioredoxin
MASKYAGKVRAPEFPSGAEWLNTDEPPTLSSFSGKLLILDFWAYCCINCIHIIPALRRLERHFPDELAVVGVHSPKFDQEHATENIRQAIMRYGVSHPVINDANMSVWQSYTIRAWPTLMFVDPEGKVIGAFEGELTYEMGVPLIDEMLAEFRQAGTLRPSPTAHRLEEAPLRILSYPGKVLADEENERLFVSDTGHHRVLVTDLDGVVQTFIGSGEAGLADGVLEGALLNRPQGLALAGEMLFIADTENHAIRMVDLEMGTVETLAGTGKQGQGHVEGGPALDVDMRSPWDIVLTGRVLFIAMAGSHQLWMVDLNTNVLQAVVGTGAEQLRDGPPEEAELAQPSGITADEDDVLYFADSETSSIRLADLRTTHHVGTLVGTGLFEFGDIDGHGSQARLQHPLGVDYDQETGFLFVADTYNNKIKRITLEEPVVTTVAGSGAAGQADGPLAAATFFEPGGLSITGTRIYVADTNNHAIRVVDLGTGQVSTLEVDF